VRIIIMNRFKVMATIFCVSLMALVFSPRVEADGWNKKTVVTFSQPVEIPGGIILPAGTYVFKLLDSMSDRHIVQIFNRDQTHIYATILAVPNYRLQVTDRTVMTFGERWAGTPQAIRAWFYPGDNSGQEFVYPKRRALELAKVTSLPVLAMPSELESEIAKSATSLSEEPVVALKEAPLTAVKPTGEEVEITQVVTPPPVQTTDTDSTKRMELLPQTASQLPLLGSIGLLSLCAGFALWAVQKRTA
jgi:hypothetical protein